MFCMRLGDCGAWTEMTLEIPECEEHLADVPVANCQRSAHNLDTGSEIERIESNGVMKYVESMTLGV